jgi:hypothetical protein
MTEREPQADEDVIGAQSYESIDSISEVSSIAEDSVSFDYMDRDELLRQIKQREGQSKADRDALIEAKTAMGSMRPRYGHSLDD